MIYRHMGVGKLWSNCQLLQVVVPWWVLFLFIHGDVDSELLLSRLNFNVSVRPTRNFELLSLNYTEFELLSLNYYRSDYENNDPFRRTYKAFNECHQVVNFLGCKDVFKLLIWSSYWINIINKLLLITYIYRFIHFMVSKVNKTHINFFSMIFLFYCKLWTSTLYGKDYII